MVKTTPRICILGGGFGGLYTALHLSRCRWPRSTLPEITLVDQKDHFLFTPLLYELVTEELQLWEIAPAFQQLLAQTKVQFCQETVQGVDLAKRQVQLQSGTLAYDRLVLAVGRKTLLDIVPGAAAYACPFRTLSDVKRLQERLGLLETCKGKSLRLAIAGGGPSGVELACKLADRLQQGQLCLIDRGEQILQDFSRPSRKAAQRALLARGIQVALETSIKTVKADQVTLVHQGQDKTIPVDLVIWTIGTQAWEWVHRLDCQHNSQGQLLALPTLQLLDHADVFCLGDLAEMQDAQGKSVPATAQAAWQQAKVAAWNLRASLIGRPLLCFRYQHLGEMLTLGKQAAVVSSFRMHLAGRLAYAVRQWAYLLRMPTLDHRLQVGGHWLKTLVLRGLTRCWQGVVSLVLRLLPHGGGGSMSVRRQPDYRTQKHASSEVARQSRIDSQQRQRNEQR